MEPELFYDQRDYEIGGARYDGPTDVIEEEEDDDHLLVEE